MPGLVWAWVALQVGALIVGLVYPSPVWVKVAEVAVTAFLLVYFVRARRWAWWLVLALSVVGVLSSLGRWLTGHEQRSAILVTYGFAYDFASLFLVLAPSVRRYFREWRGVASG